MAVVSLWYILFKCYIAWLSLAYVEPISVYTKFLVNVRCKYDDETLPGTSKYCPGYSDAMSLPFRGSKSDKLRKFSDVFCSRCQQEDEMCRRLFCSPEYLLVDAALAMIDTLCSAINTEDSSCYNAFCNDGISKRSSNNEAMADIQDIETNSNITCVAVADWSNTEGMDDWCVSNCPMGNDDTTCLPTYCDCRSREEVTTLTTPSGSSLADCSDWEASWTYSGVSGMTAWCKTVCRTGVCPPSHCQCVVEETTSISSSTGNTTDALTTSSTVSTTSDNSSAVSSTSTPLTAIPNSPSEESTSHPSIHSFSHTMSSSTDVASSSPGTSERTTSTLGPFSLSAGTVSTPFITSPSSIHASSQSPATESASTTLTSSLPVSSTTQTKGTSTGSTGMTSPQESSSFSSSLSSFSTDTSILSTTSTVASTTSLSTTPLLPVTSVPPATTTESQNVNETEQTLAGLHVMNNVICEHTLQLGQTPITNRFCDSYKQDGVHEYKGYSADIIVRVLKFAPSLICSFMSNSNNSECARLYCGESLLLEEAIKLSMCSVCRQLTGTIGRGCSAAYCAA